MLFDFFLRCTLINDEVCVLDVQSYAYWIDIQDSEWVVDGKSGGGSEDKI